MNFRHWLKTKICLCFQLVHEWAHVYNIGSLCFVYVCIFVYVISHIHWLPLSFRIQYKIAILAFHHFDNSLPPYLSQSLAIYQSSCTLHSSEKILKVPKRNLKNSDRCSLAPSAPRAWNSLPTHLRNSPNLSIFKSCLKTHLFNLAFNCYTVSLPTQLVYLLNILIVY